MQGFLRRLTLHTQSKRRPDKTCDEWRNCRRRRGNAASLWVSVGGDEDWQVADGVILDLLSSPVLLKNTKTASTASTERILQGLQLRGGRAHGGVYGFRLKSAHVTGVQLNYNMEDAGKI